MINACNNIQQDIQSAAYLANKSVDLEDIWNHLYQMNIYIQRRIKAQIKPNSSTITENIKSHCTSGKYQNFWIEPQNHKPVKPQLHIAIKACSVW